MIVKCNYLRSILPFINMPNTVIAASLTLDSQQATQSVASFRTQLRNATNDLIVIQEEFGQTSAEAVAAAQAVARLRDRMNDARAIADAFNPDAKFAALTKAVQVAAGGITALTGAMALFGSESGDVQKALLKVQGALALSQGLSQIGEMGKAFGVLKVAAVEAFTAIKVAIGSTGIGLIVVAVGVLVTYWDEIKASIGLASAAQLKALEYAKEDVAAEQSKLDILNTQDHVLKQQGVSEQAILDSKIAQTKELLKAQKIELERQLLIQKIAEDATHSTIATLLRGAPGRANPLGWLGNLIYGDPVKVADANAKANADLKLQLSKTTDQIAAYEQDKIKDKSAFDQKLRQMDETAAEASITDAYVLSQRKLKDAYEAQQVQIKLDYTNTVERNEQLGAAANAFAAQSKALALKHDQDLADAREKARYEQYLVGITNQKSLSELAIKEQLLIDNTEAERHIANLDERNKKIADNTKLAEDKLHQLQLDDQLKFEVKWNDAIGKQAAQQQAQSEKEIADFLDTQKELVVKSKEEIFAENFNLNTETANMNLDAAGQQAAASLEQLNKWYFDKQKLLKGNAAGELALTKQYEHQKTQITQIENAARLQIISSVLGQAADLFGRATVAGKAIAIAQATIDTYQSATASYKALAGIPVVGPTLGYAAAAIAIAAGLANVRKILSVQVPNASDTSSGGGLSASAPLQPSPQIGNTQLPQDQINKIGNATVRAFVVESDIDKDQSRTKRLNRAARLGG